MQIVVTHHLKLVNGTAVDVNYTIFIYSLATEFRHVDCSYLYSHLLTDSVGFLYIGCIRYRTVRSKNYL
jgi:hypothetical protein